MKQSANTVTIATITIALCMTIIVSTLSIIVVRDGHNDLVSQAMGELLWLGGIAIAVLAGLLGFTKFLESGTIMPSSTTQTATVSTTVQAPAVAAATAPTPAQATDPASLLSGDVQAMLTELLASRVHTAVGDQPTTVLPKVASAQAAQ